MNGFFGSEEGKSMMRLLSFIITIAGITWGTAEVVAYIVMQKYGQEFDIHETLILTMISIGIAGKGAQKYIEGNK